MIRAVWSGVAVSDNDRLSHSRQGRMFANKDYTAFKDGMAWAICPRLIPYEDIPDGRLRGRVSVTLRVDLPPRMDTSAVIKACGDAIELSGAIANDNQIDKWTVERVGRSPRGESRIEFEIEEV